MTTLPTSILADKPDRRPTVTLALIAKNEEKNIRRLLNSVDKCFDEIVLVDTGSFDKTKEIAEQYGCKTFDFLWVDNFAKARNFAFSKATSDFIVWMDLDDVLHKRESFIQWRDHAMEFIDCAFATYNYALDASKKSADWPDGSPICSFVRERAFRRSVNPTWQYDLHEGVIVKPEWQRDYAVTWAINHLRDQEDIKADKSRNIRILEGMKGNFDARLQFYYGKELFEAGRNSDAVIEFQKAVARPDLEHHDKVLAYQYGAYSAQAAGDQLKDEAHSEKQKYYDLSKRFAIEGLVLDPNRAEFFVIMADLAIKTRNLPAAIPYFSAAKNCINPKKSGSPYEGALYSFLDCYGQLPSVQLSKVYLNVGMLDEAEREAKECVEKYDNAEAKLVLAEIGRIRPLIKIDGDQAQTEEIVFTCPPQTAYTFDEEIYKTKPIGGSETALVQMARLIREKTGRVVKVFNMREQDMVASSGVEYISTKKTNEYFSKFKPRAHIAWRHNIKITNAKTYLWAHDLVTPTVESVNNFDKMLCLTDFHKQYTMAKSGVSPEKIILTRNGIDPDKFPKEKKAKDPNKFVYTSSPDRGLDGAMLVMDEVRKEFPDARLEIYYGTENLRKYGLFALADKIDQMLAARPWVINHGFTEQTQMYRELADAAVWIHPATFIETYCITALEMQALGVFPVTRRLGALANTLADAEARRGAILLDHAAVTPEEVKAYANACCRAVLNRQWNNVSLDMNANSWSAVADAWVKQMEL